jgi:hypothetical protein
METKLKSTDRPIQLSYVFLSDVVSFQKIGDSYCEVNISSQWKTINTSIGSIEIQETTKKTNAGTAYSTKLNATIPGHDESSPSDTFSFSGRKALLLINYRSGLKKIIGGAGTAPTVYIETISNTSTKRTLIATLENTEPNRLIL